MAVEAVAVVEVAAVDAYLASENARYISGETIYVDGGRLALNHTMPLREKVEV